MIFVGIDDTDMPDTPGTNQLARVLVAQVADQFRCRHILRHQLLDDPRVPYTSKNGSASIVLEPRGPSALSLEDLIAALRTRMLEWYIQGSDPGLCVTKTVPDVVIEFGQRCQRELVTRSEAERLATQHGIFLQGLGGTWGGMIGALAAVGLAATGNDGRVVVNAEWPDDLTGWQPIETLAIRGVIVKRLDTGEILHQGEVDVGKHLRPNFRAGSFVQFVRPAETPSGQQWLAVRLT